jgi:hypothetical protein
MVNEIPALRKHLEMNHQQLWNEWIEWKKDEPKGEKWPTKKRFGPTPSTITNKFKLKRANGAPIVMAYS